MKPLRWLSGVSLALVLIVSMGLSVGCTKDNTNSENTLLAPTTLHLVGNWKHQDAPITMQLNEDHSGTKADTLETRQFTWDTEGKHLIFTYDDNPEAPEVAQYTVGAADLNLIWPDNTTERYVRQ